jgi:hypothetical protein
VVNDTDAASRRTVLQSLGTAVALGGIGLASGAEGNQPAETLSALGTVSVDGAAEAVAGPYGVTAFVSTDTGFVSVDVSDPSSPAVLATQEDTGVTGIRDVKVDRTRLIVHGGAHSEAETNGVALYDVSNPAVPERLAFVETDYGIHNAFLEGGTAYLVNNSTAEMVMFDITDDDLTEAGRWGLDGARVLHDLWIQDDIAYLNYWDAGTAMVDVSNPAKPWLVGMVRTGSDVEPNNDHYVMVDEDASLLAIGKEQFSSPAGIELWDISSTRDTAFLAEIQPPSGSGTRTSHNFDIVDGYLYTSWYSAGVRVHDISEPSTPEQVAAWTPEEAFIWTAKVARTGEFVLASDYGGGALYTLPDPRTE